MLQSLKSETRALLRNLFLGLQLLRFQRIELERFSLGHDRIAVLVLFYALLNFVASLLASLPNPEFSITGVADIATQFALVMLSLYIISKVVKLPLEPLAIMVLSVWPWFFLIWMIVEGDKNFAFWAFYGEHSTLYIVYNLYFLIVLGVAIERASQANLKAYVSALGVFLLVTFVPVHYMYPGQFWSIAYNYEEELAAYNQVNQEETYYRQFDFINELKASLLPSREGVTDLYYVGFGSYADEDVFMNEIKFTKVMFDERFNTEGRSVALINNYKTLEDVPLATKTNFDLVLNHIGEIIDPEEDIVFVYLTSHGSRKHKLSVDLDPLDLNTLGPEDLRAALDEAGIKWRVILVSACYSGGFVEPLKDPYTLVMTAAAPDRTSFGCGSQSKFTYFGNAVFREQLSTKYDFLTAFTQAIASIYEREAKEKRKHSQPQLYIGTQIQPKLADLTHKLENFDVANSDANR